MIPIISSLTENDNDKLLCKVQLKQKDIEQLKHAIEELYYYEFIIGMLIFILLFN